MDKRKDILDGIVKSIRKMYNKESIMTLEERLCTQKVDCISTGCISVDIAMGGGIPRGKVIEVFGPESSGKTTFAINVVKQVQKASGVAAYIDVEHAFDPEYAKSIGIDPVALFIAQPDSGDDALNMVIQLASSGAIDLIVVDSVAALVSKNELAGNVGDSFMGVQARLMAQALRKIVPIISKNKCTLLFINQVREKIGVIFGSNEVTPGGRALKFAATIRVEIRRISAIKREQEDIGIRSRIRIVKNKVAPPFRTSECEIFFGKGVSEESSLIDAALDMGILEKKGSWISLAGENVAQGKDNLRQLCYSNQDLKSKILEMVNNKIKEITFTTTAKKEEELILIKASH